MYWNNLNSAKLSSKPYKATNRPCVYSDKQHSWQREHTCGGLLESDDHLEDWSPDRSNMIFLSANTTTYIYIHILYTGLMEVAHLYYLLDILVYKGQGQN